MRQPEEEKEEWKVGVEGNDEEDPGVVYSNCCGRDWRTTATMRVYRGNRDIRVLFPSNDIGQTP